MTACAGMPPAQRRQYTRRERRRHSDIGPALLFALMLAMAREVAGQAECPAPEDADSMETGQRGIDLIKAGDIAEAASCFWRASDRSGSEQESAGWLKNAAQASEQLNEVDVEGVQAMTTPVAFPLPMRKDEITDGGIRDQVLANAPKSDEGFFVVPKSVE